MTVRVLIADDQQLMRAGLRLIVEQAEDLTVVGEAESGDVALHNARRLKPDVVLMEVRMPGMDGLEATRRLLADPDNRARVIVLTTFDLDEYVYAALRAGAAGFLLKGAPTDPLVEAIRVVAAGDALLAPPVTCRLIAEFTRRLGPDGHPSGSLDALAARELDVLRLLARGLSNGEVAAELVLGEATVKTHVARVLMKLGLRNRVQAVIYAYETGLVRAGRVELSLAPR
jgi:DNA-binding NarL/FixJ family response regulator